VREPRGLTAALLLALVLAGGGPGQSSAAAADAAVLQYHRSAARDGLYVAPALTRAAAARLELDPSFDARLDGPTYAQPLFWAATGPADRDRLVVATARNQVSALDPASGAILWRRILGPPVPRRHLPCGNIDPVGVVGTPVIDAPSRTLYLAAMTTPDDGATKQHHLFALSVDDGSVRPGWPIDVGAALRAGGDTFDAAVQGQRGALAILGDRIYVPYGGHLGDCGAYHGRVVGVSMRAPGTGVTGWATRARGGGVWAPGGIASDGTALYVATGNTMAAAGWEDGEAVIRLHPGPVFSRQRRDYFAPPNWPDLDARDADLGGTGPIFPRAPGGRPLVLALGKDGEAYVLDRVHLGGVGAPLARLRVSRDAIIGAAAAYTTPRGAYVVFSGRGLGCPDGQSGDLTALRLGSGSLPSLAVAWCGNGGGRGSPIVTTTDGQSDPIVWSVGADGDNRLHGVDGDTGRPIFDGGGASATMARLRRYQTPLVARGRIYVAADDRVYVFRVR
jgi:PQQ-like domain